MVHLSATEKILHRKLKDEKLSQSLVQLRGFMESLWIPEAPRIIKDFTDHGPKHIERVAAYADKILQAQDGKALTVSELYLLLAGIYLHDIGMQCDVMKLPEVRSNAERLGAKFSIDFTSNEASAYTINEQKEIRRWHNYLSAAWVDYAARTGNTGLGSAARTIPRELIDDLMDIIRFHTTLPISDCSNTLKYDGSGRKQLVAAILRMADELDVDSTRVTFDTVQQFSLPPRNELYWWLHSRTKVMFPSPNEVELIVKLHPYDVEAWGDLVSTVFISEFQGKNQPVVSVLNKHRIPFVISWSSRIVGDDREERLPSSVLSALAALVRTADALSDLATEVGAWLRAIGYEVTARQRIDSRTEQMIASIAFGSVKQRVSVRCIAGEITSTDVESLETGLERKLPEGWLICDYRIAPSAVQAVNESEFVSAFSLSGFLRQKVWSSYFDMLQDLVETQHIQSLYVDPCCYKEEADEEGNVTSRQDYASLDMYIDGWLRERGKTHISLLGEFGAGKTWFCLHYALRQLDRYLANPAGERLPLLITLRHFSKATTVTQLVNDTLIERYRLNFAGSAYEVFQELNRQGKLLIILDGFDEMASKVDTQTVVDNFWALAKMVFDKSKVILTSRTEYFRQAKESEKILSGREYGRETLKLDPPKFEVLYLEPFSPPQIREMLVKRLGLARGNETADRVLENPNLADMARKPVQMELLLSVLDKVDPSELETPTQVYRYAAENLILRNISTKRTFTSTSDKVFFLCELAWEMITTRTLSIHYSEFPNHIRTHFGDRIKDQYELDNWDYDLRSQTLLHRNAAGYYEFAHKSLAEFFAALKYLAKLRQRDWSVFNTWDHYNEFLNVVAFVVDLLDRHDVMSLMDLLKDLESHAQPLLKKKLVKGRKNRVDRHVGIIIEDDTPMQLWMVTLLLLRLLKKKRTGIDAWGEIYEAIRPAKSLTSIHVLCWLYQSGWLVTHLEKITQELPEKRQETGLCYPCGG